MREFLSGVSKSYTREHYRLQILENLQYSSKVQGFFCLGLDRRFGRFETRFFV